MILESGVPVTLPLYPGECNPPKETSYNEGQERLQQAENQHPGFNNIRNSEKNSKNNIKKEAEGRFTPTQVVRVGLNDSPKEYGDNDQQGSTSVDNVMDIFSIPWKIGKTFW